jgi:hypothetical protein
MPRNFRLWSAILLLAALFCFLSVLLDAAPQPLPEAVTRAHTVFLENETGFNELQYVVVLELSKWQRFDLAETRDKADLILLLDNGNRVRLVPDGQLPSTDANNPAGPDIPKGYTRIALLDPKSNSLLWSDIHKTDGGKVKSGHLLDGLREAFDAYDKSRR